MLRPIVTRRDGTEESFGNATGFIVERESAHYLITNWHVVSGRHPANGQLIAPQLGLPDKIEIFHNQLGAAYIMSWLPAIEQLVDPTGRPRWLEHPRFGRRVDVVALPLTFTSGINFMTYSLDDGSSGVPVLTADVPDPVSIIGFPFGEAAAGNIAIWVRGSIATDMEINYGRVPCFLVDARTRQGQSGSPVIVYKGESGTGRMSDGSIVSGPGIMSNLLGVYSGRIIGAESDLGRVWKTAAVREILEHGIPGNGGQSP